MNSRWLVATGCLIAALAMGVAACGDDETATAAAAAAARRLTSPSTRRSRCRAPRARRRPRWSTASSSRSSRPATRPATSRSSTSRSTTRPRRPARGRLRRPANARKAAQDDTTAVYIGEFNSGATAVSMPILNEAGVPQISPANTARRPDHGRAGRRPGRAGQVLPDRAAHLHAHRPEGHDPGRRAGDAHEGGRLHEGPVTNDKEVYGAGLAKNIELAAEEQGLEIVANEAIDKNAAELPLARPEGQGRRRGLLRVLGHHRQQRGPALQGLRGGAAGREALRAGRRRRDRLRRPKEGGIPADVAAKRQGDGRDAVAGRVPAGGPGVLHAVRREVRRGQPRPVRDLRLRGDAPRARRDRALRHRARRRTSSRRCSTPRTARACSAPTRSTRTATRR